LKSGKHVKIGRTRLKFKKIKIPVWISKGNVAGDGSVLWIEIN
jgi:hypothetical protein